MQQQTYQERPVIWDAGLFSERPRIEGGPPEQLYAAT